MSLKELVENAKKSVPALASVPDAKAVALLREVFRQVGQQVGEAKEGSVKVAGLGKFKIKVGEKEKDGEKSATRRILFKVAEAKEGKPGGKGKGGNAGGGKKAGKGARSGKAGKAGKAGKGAGKAASKDAGKANAAAE